MSLLVTSPRDGDSFEKEQEVVPPLFAGPVREDLVSRIRAVLSSGDHEKAGVLLREADGSFPSDSIFPALHLRAIRLGQRKTHFETALEEAVNELRDDRFVASLGKFREALSLSRGYEIWERKVYEASVAAAGELTASHWRFAEELLHEVTAVVSQPAVPSAVWTSIERQKREERVRVALDESGRAEHLEYLPHLRDRLAELAKIYPEEEGLGSRLRVLNGILAQRSTEEREKNLRRLTLFRARLDLTNNPQTLGRFRELVSPFVDPYRDDPAFVSILDDLQGLHSTYDTAARLVAENRSQEALQICDQVLQQRPASVLFCELEEKAKAREWVMRLVYSARQRARAFEQKAQYAEALEEWESLREIDPNYPGLDSEILHCGALKAHTTTVEPPQRHMEDESALTPEIVYESAEGEDDAPPMFVSHLKPRVLPRVKITITEEAWNRLKTGLAATAALLLVVLVLASSTGH
jgi:tetratricopeptide (TPR) repeat protein